MHPGEAILLPCSEIALPELPQILRARGGVVDEVSAYTVKSAHPDTVVLNQLVGGQIDIVTFFSPSGLFGLTEIMAEAGFTDSLSEILAPATVACIGPSTEKAAREMDLQVEVVAQEHTSTGLVQELVRWRKHL
jgi:uroporphyrinogen III methyltransferase/synthase